MKCPIKSAAYLRQWGLTQEQFEVLWADGKCPICRKPYAHTPNRYACVDHDHETGIVRGLLCAACNYALGSKSEIWFLRVALYLNKTPAWLAGILVRPKEWSEE